MAGPVVARLPAKLSLVLTSRAEPQLKLHRLRLAAELTEIRASDLRFSLEEARGLLRASEIELPEEALVLLHQRTEGWAAGLRLAVISLARHPDPERFVRDFSGSERSVAGYLMAEVLERQPPEVRELLLRTSILDRVTGRLADAMTGGSDSERILLELEEANAFVTSLDATAPGFATTICSPTSCGSSCAAPTPPASTLCTAWQLAGTRSTDIRPRRSVTRRRQRTGRTRRACLPTATSA